MSRLAWDRSQLVVSGAISQIAGTLMRAREVDAPMAVSGSPAVARYRLRVALREAREAKGLTQRQVAKALDWSLSKVARIELGEVSISTTDVRALLEILEVTAPDRQQLLVEEARLARQRSWWEQSEYRSHLTSAMIERFQFETEATEIRSFQPTFLPGVLQTRAYASAVLALWHDYLSEADRGARLEARRRLRDQLFNRPSPPLYLLALDESVLMRSIAGPNAMSEQLNELLRLIEEGRVIVRIAPLEHGAGYAAFGLFTLFSLRNESVMLYREGLDADDIVYETSTIIRYRSRFDRIWEQSLAADASARLIEARVANLCVEVDRQ